MDSDPYSENGSGFRTDSIRIRFRNTVLSGTVLSQPSAVQDCAVASTVRDCTYTSKVECCPGLRWVQLIAVQGCAEYSWTQLGTALRKAEHYQGQSCVKLNLVKDNAVSSWGLCGTDLSQAERCTVGWVNLYQKFEIEKKTVCGKLILPPKNGKGIFLKQFLHNWLANLHRFANICKLPVSNTFKDMHKKIW